MANFTKTQQVAIQLALELDNSIIFDTYISGYRRVRRDLVEKFVKDKGELKFNPSKGMWRNAWRIVMNRMRHANAAREAINWTQRNGKTESRTELAILDQDAIKQVGQDMANGKPEHDWPVQPQAPTTKLAVAILMMLVAPKIQFLEVDGATFVHEGNVESDVKSEYRLDYSPKRWPDAWQRLIDFLVIKGAVATKVDDENSADAKQLATSSKLMIIKDAKKLREFADDPTPLIKVFEVPSKTKIKHPQVPNSKESKSRPKATNTLPPQSESEKVGYARFATELTDIDKYVQQLGAAGADEIFIDKQGEKSVRQPKWREMMDRVEPGDTVIVPDLLRLSATVQGALHKVEALIKVKANLTVLDIGKLIEFDANGELTVTSNAMVKTFVAVTELNHAAVLERTQIGKAYAKKHDQDYKEGRKPVVQGERLAEMLTYYEKHTVKETIKKFGVSESTLMRRVRESRNGK
ncbi:recombinase family protein [Loigolactobacillus coryniformis]|uniref:recombinase family protein n=1 Tax=Loigolactobacillus coryniformis TaxID=1610 RepID=UPI00021923A7|nr:recombinase family protein [Loigolactobacillus coryniformis]